VSIEHQIQKDDPAGCLIWFSVSPSRSASCSSDDRSAKLVSSSRFSVNGDCRLAKPFSVRQTPSILSLVFLVPLRVLQDPHVSSHPFTTCSNCRPVKVHSLPVNLSHCFVLCPFSACAPILPTESNVSRLSSDRK
jgi:hypothetical protein